MSLNLKSMIVLLVFIVFPFTAASADPYTELEKRMQAQYWPWEDGLKAKGFVRRAHPTSPEDRMVWTLPPASSHEIIPPFKTPDRETDKVVRENGKFYKEAFAEIPGLLEPGDKTSPQGKEDLKNFLYDIYKLETKPGDVCELGVEDEDCIVMQINVVDADGMLIAHNVGEKGFVSTLPPRVKFTAKGGPVFFYVLPKDADGIGAYFLNVSLKRLVEPKAKHGGHKPGDDFSQ